MEHYNILFLDIDGVLNCQVFYEQRGWPTGESTHEEENICRKRVKWLSDLCKETNSVVVISSSWRSGRTTDYFQDLFDSMGGEFQVRGLTPFLHFLLMGNTQKQPYYMPTVPRGSEIKYWLDHTPIKVGNYAIIDDDGDMLLEQASHFFQTDPYAGLTPYTCQRIKDFLTPKP